MGATDTITVFPSVVWTIQATMAKVEFEELVEAVRLCTDYAIQFADAAGEQEKLSDG